MAGPSSITSETCTPKHAEREANQVSNDPTERAPSSFPVDQDSIDIIIESSSVSNGTSLHHSSERENVDGCR